MPGRQPMTSEEKLRIIRTWTSDFCVDTVGGLGLYRAMHRVTIIMNPKFEPLSYYYDTEDEAILSTYEKMNEFVWRTVLIVSI